MVVRDAGSQRIVLSLPRVSDKRIIILPRGSYEFSADNAAKTVLDLQNDCRIVFSGRAFKGEALKEPPVIAFRRSPQGVNSSIPLIEGVPYFLAVLDMDDLNNRLPIGSYTAAISGKGNVELNGVKENNYIISKSAYTFVRGSYTVTVTGSAAQINPFRFRVEPRPPFTLTITNIWNGKPLQFADIAGYKSNARLNPVLPRNDNGKSPISYTSFDYSNRGAVLRPAGESNTGADGKISFPGISHDDRVVLVVMGVNPADDVYTHTIIADEGRRNLTVSWDRIPAKGRNFQIEAPVDRNSFNSWDRIDNFSVSFLYKPGTPATIPIQTVLNGNSGFNEIKGISYRRETENSITCFVDLQNISKVSQFNYLITVKDVSLGTFAMNNTSAEISRVPQPLRKQE
jgi:hypothetical protein